MPQLATQPTSQSLAQAPMPQEDADRKREMHDAWIAFRGKLQDPLKVERNERNHNVKPNRCSPIVAKGVSFLFGPTVKIEPEKASDQDHLDAVWGDDDDKMTMLSEMAMNGGVCGQVFVKLIPPKLGMKYPRIVNLDPQIVRIVTDPEDCKTVLAYVIEYHGNPTWQKRQIIARVDPDNEIQLWGNNDPGDTWTITNYTRKGTTGPWIQIDVPEEWPYPFAPVFTCQNLPNPNEPWGIPDLTDDLIAMNKAINFLVSNIAKIVYYHGHPKLWTKGIRAELLRTAIEDILCIEAPDGSLNQLLPMENFSGLLSVLADLRSDMDEQSRVPAVALGRMQDMPKGNISGVALQLLFQPLIEKTIQKQRLYGKLIREISRAALVLCGQLPVEQYETYKVDLHFQNLLPVDDLAAAQTAQILQTIGVSNDTLMQQLGYDSDKEVEKSADEDAKKNVAYSRGQGLPPTPPQQQIQQDAQMQQAVGEGSK